jgi:hypothetical protein
LEDSTFSIDCSACGKPAAEISFAAGREFGLAIARRGFIGDVFAGMLGRQDATPELFAEIRGLARKDDLRSLIAIDPDFFGFICGRCDAA